MYVFIHFFVSLCNFAFEPKPKATMTPIIKNREGKIMQVARPGEISKKANPELFADVLKEMKDSGKITSVETYPEENVRAALGPSASQIKRPSRISKRLKASGRGRNNPRKGLKNACASDYIPYPVASATGWNQLRGKNPVIGFYILFAIDSGLRTSDLQGMEYADFVGKQAGDILRIQETKTGLVRDIRLTRSVIEAFAVLYAWYVKRNGGEFINDYIFLSQKKMIYTTVSLNRILKKIFSGTVGGNISTHSLRKTFGRTFFERANAKGLDGLTYLNEIFGHASHAITRRYLGLTKAEIADSYILMDER